VQDLVYPRASLSGPTPGGHGASAPPPRGAEALCHGRIGLGPASQPWPHRPPQVGRISGGSANGSCVPPPTGAFPRAARSRREWMERDPGRPGRRRPPRWTVAAV